MSRPGSKWVLPLAILLTVPAAMTAYFRSFGGFEPYDDEGTLIEMVRGFLEGRPLYNSVSTMYGPAYFFYEWLAHTLAGRPVTTDSVRFVSMVFWLGSALLVLTIAWRATGSWMIAAAAYLPAFEALHFVGLDPAHPQELCLFLALALALAGCFPKNPTALMLWLGGIAGAAALTKINMGVLVALALGLTLVYATGDAPAWKALRIAAALGAIALPLMLMWPNLGMTWARCYLALEELSLAGIVIVVARQRFDVRLGVRELAVFGAGFAAVSAALALFVIVHGSTLWAMTDWVFVKPRSSFGPAWYWAPPGIGTGVMVWASLGLIAAVAAQSRWVAPWMIATAKLALGTVVLALAVSERTDQIMYAAPPFLWLVAMPQAANARLGTFSRVLIGTMGVLIVLYAYPVAGAQVPFVAVFLLAAAAVVFGDGARWFAARGPLIAWGRWPAYAVVAVAVFRFCALAPLRAREHYDWQQPLGLPGAARLHLEPADAAALREVVSAARRSCSLLLTAPGMPTFNAWSGLPAPQGIGGGNWITTLDDAGQQRVVAEMSREPRACVMYNAEQIAMWTHDADVSARPVIHYVRENFRAEAEGRGNVLMVRR
jgi:hypothetical protein